MRVLSASLLALALLFAGCATDPTTETSASLPSVSDVTTPDIETFRADETVFHRVPFAPNGIGAPVVLDLSGELGPADCEPTGHAGGLSRSRQFWDLSTELASGDAFTYEFHLSYTNTDNAWAEFHPKLGIGNTYHEHGEPVKDLREPVMIHWTGQSYFMGDDDLAFLSTECSFGNTRTPLPYEMRLTLTFIERGVPAETPFLLVAPAGATQLLARGIPFEEGGAVLSHYRILTPDGALVCECAIATTDPFVVTPLPGAGSYIIMVDHSDAGTVEFALDVPVNDPLRRARVVEVETVLAENTAIGAFHETRSFDLPNPPLLMAVFATPPEGELTFSRSTAVSLAVMNERGSVLSKSWGGYAILTWPMIDHIMVHNVATAAEGWGHAVDHHLYAGGAHTATIDAEEFQGRIVLVTRHFTTGAG